MDIFGVDLVFGRNKASKDICVVTLSWFVVQMQLSSCGSVGVGTITVASLVRYCPKGDPQLEIDNIDEFLARNGLRRPKPIVPCQKSKVEVRRQYRDLLEARVGLGSTKRERSDVSSFVSKSICLILLLEHGVKLIGRAEM